MKKDKRINLNDKRGFKTQLIFLSYLIFYLYLTFKYWDELSIKTGLCDSCGGIFGIIRNPLPGVFFAILLIGTTYLLPKVIRSDYWDYSERGKTIREIVFDNGDVYYGQVKDTDDGHTSANGRGFLTKKNGLVIKGLWKNGKFLK